jgi:CubicO group peptidase (beta-lactamase class C family)
MKLEGYGMANLELSVAVTPETVFKAGSVSKQFIAAGILLLEQDGKLNVEDPVSKHLPDTPEAWKGITIRHLLSHTGGLVRESPAFNPLRTPPDFDLVKAGYRARLEFEPGEKYQYSNLGYFAAAEIIARVSGKPWPAYLAERIFSPLGMTATRTTTQPELVPNRADGYDWREGKFTNELPMMAVRPSGALLTTVADMAKWDAALNGDEPLTAAAREKMWTSVKLNGGKDAGYGLGWQIKKHGERRLVDHGGTLGGFKAHYARFPDDKVSVVVLTNMGAADPAVILFKIAEEVLAAPAQ